ncbi:MAG: DNA polymerase III subunit gamma/tau [Ignavibacteriales bacterium]|nr:DNA polymerase III subunit gamma/tau [Ignavibacteriales bacterium]
MSYQVTARKWRPMVFEDVVGQSHVTNTLRNAISSNRLAHAYIFSGARGCGKTTTARILAKAINCISPNNVNPDNACEICQEITAGRSLDVIEIDGASNRGVEEIRNLRESVRYTPTRGKYKVYIIDEVHMLTKEAFNALLKTLEEPPQHVIFIFATTEVHKIPMTILSRCQRFDFRRIGIDEIVARLRFIAQEEKVSIDDNALLIIAKKGDGSLRDAQSIFDQIRSFCGNEIAATDVLKVLNVVDQEIFFRVTDLIKAHDLKGGMELVDEIVRNGYDLREFLGGLAEHLRNLLVVLTTDSPQLIETSEPYKKRYQEESKNFKQNDALRLIKLVNDLEQSIRWAPQPRFKLEAGLLQMIKMESAVQIDSLLRQIDDLKKKLDSGAPPSNGNGASHQTSAPSELKVVGSVSAGRLKSASAYTMTSFMTQAGPSNGRVPPQPLYPPQTNSPRTAATIPLMRSAGELTTLKETSLQYQNATPLPQGADYPPQNGKAISVEDAYSLWQEVVGEVRKSKISLGTILGESQILDVAHGTLRIACPDDFHFSTIKRNKEFLVESFQKISGTKVFIEPVLHAEKSFQPASHAASVTHIQAVGLSELPGNGKAEEHPVLLALKRELGAELVR